MTIKLAQVARDDLQAICTPFCPVCDCVQVCVCVCVCVCMCMYLIIRLYSPTCRWGTPWSEMVDMLKDYFR